MFAILGILFTTVGGMFVRARGLDRAERRDGFTTLTGGAAGLELRDPVTGEVVQPDSPSPLSLPLADGSPPIFGTTAPDVRTERGTALTLLHLAPTYTAAAALIATALLAWGTFAFDVPGVIALTAAVLSSAAIVYCIIGPAAALTRARCDFLVAQTGARTVWCVWVGAALDDLVLTLPVPGTRASDPTATFVMYLAENHDSIAFWTRRGRTYEQVLSIPTSRLRSVVTTTDFSTGQPQIQSVVSVLANNGETIEIQANALPTSLRIRAASRDMTTALNAAVAASRDQNSQR